MNYLDYSIQQALSNGMVLSPVTAGTKDKRIISEPVTCLKDWQDRQAEFGPDINAAIWLSYSDLCLIDIDTADGLRALRNEIVLPRTVTVKTPRGYHLLYRRDDVIANSGEIVLPGPNPIGQFLCGNWLDQYSMLPGAVRDDGGRYFWSVAPGVLDSIPVYPHEIYRVVEPDTGTGPYWDGDDDGEDYD